MGKSSPSMPPPPDPYASASAQGRMNQEQAILEAQLNRNNVVSPWGTSTWEQTAAPSAASQDPNFAAKLAEAQRVIAIRQEADRVTGGNNSRMFRADADAERANLDALLAMQAPGATSYTQRIALSPAEQLAQSQGYQRGTAANDAIMRKYGEIQNSPGLGSLPQMISGLNTSGLPGLKTGLNLAGMPGLISGLNMSGLPGLKSALNLEGMPELIRSLNLQGLPDISGGPGGYEGSRRAVEEAMMSRIQPQFDRQRSSLQTEMANMGIPMGSEMYSTGFNELNQGLNDARMQAVLAGGQEQSRLFDMASRGRGQLTQEQLANAGLASSSRQQLTQEQSENARLASLSRQQLTQEQLSNAGLASAARQQLTGEQQMTADMASQARQQLVGEQLSNAGLAAQARQQGVSEQQLPYQQIAMLLGGIPNPGQIPTNPMGNTQMAPGDFQGAQQAAYQAQQQAAQQRAQQQAQMAGNTTSLLGTLAMAGAMAYGSDERMKEGVKPYEGEEGLAKIMAMDPKQYQYKDGFEGAAPNGDGTQHGLIAQELAKISPEAVVQDGNGMMGIQYMKLIPELLAAVQEQQQQINRVKKRT